MLLLATLNARRQYDKHLLQRKLNLCSRNQYYYSFNRILMLQVRNQAQQLTQG